ncbi:M20/M25/M40 family metallo-hydrolase [Sphingobacterium paludis]|uniref:Peptidase M28-like protein n=1 Tax=Sphingobacterium paludis TaxID=1476465 RepID=A0A4R7DA20_9SPHI|nr:M20/M25/M40 family metallo-hydrolase [Sphingobacterium paludis]TDS15906.1 peptidase M28-like protein [Sphingobacterium paludis]
MKENLRNLRTVMLCLSLLSLGKIAFAQMDTERLKKHIYFLADDNMKGRGTGSKQVKKAANYIEKEFKRYGLTPKGEKGYRQTFTAKVTRVVVKDSIRKADNIIGFIDNGAPYTIVIGAHYDHLGEGHQGSSRDSLGVGKIHNGADDNASGVAGLLELARHYATNTEKEKCNLLFIAFGAEELGLLGSKYFTEHPTLPLADMQWMLNMDMIGRYNPENGLAIIGYGTSSKFPAIFTNVKSDIKFYTSKDGNGGSDQTSFYKKNIPVLFFHTGGHDDYHKPGDDADKIDYKALHAILELERMVIDNSMNEAKMDFIWTN